MQRFLLSSFLIAMVMMGCTESKNEETSQDDDGYDETEIADPPTLNPENVSKVHVVHIIQMKFVPEVVNVNKGDTIIWINKDIVEHDVTEQDSMLWTSSRIPAGSSFKMAATTSQAYYCSLHVVMKGKIVVGGNDLAMVNLSTGITQCR